MDLMHLGIGLDLSAIEYLVLRPCVPMIHVPAKWTHAFNQDRFLVQLSLQKMSGQGVRTHPPMVLSAMSREIKQLTFF